MGLIFQNRGHLAPWSLPKRRFPDSKKVPRASDDGSKWL